MNTLTEFLYESNAIEGVYGEKPLQQAREAWDYITKFENLTNKNIMWCHGILTKDLIDEEYRGRWRMLNVTVGGRVCPTYQLVPGLMREWIEQANYLGDPLKDHIDFEHIHPFVDGNGRMGRILMNWQHLQKGEPLKIFTNADKSTEYYPLFRTNFVR